MHKYKYLTADISGTGGSIKETPEDFQVMEVPLYRPCGEGEHLYVEIEKRGMTTLDAIRRMARELGVSERDVGYAGLKDARALTRQTISIPRIAAEMAMALNIPGLTVISAIRHRNKLKLGHLAGNRFRIRVRDAAPDALERSENVLAILSARGVPNYFGEQRYGGQGNSHLIGRYIVLRDYHGAVDALMGDAALVQDERWQKAIVAYRQGLMGEAANLMPGHCRTERDVLQALLKQPENYEKAFRAVNPRLKKLYLSAYQSSLFDRLLDQRLESFDQVMTGDLAYKHANGACFLVEDEKAEAPRAEALEISPSGPMFGTKMKLPGGIPLEMEEALMQTEGITAESFNLPGGLGMEGERRPLRVPLTDARASRDDEGTILEFALHKGSYATSVLREIMKK